MCHLFISKHLTRFTPKKTFYIERGATIVEYAILLVFLVLATSYSISTLSYELRDPFFRIAYGSEDGGGTLSTSGSEDTPAVGGYVGN